MMKSYLIVCCNHEGQYYWSRGGWTKYWSLAEFFDSQHEAQAVLKYLRIGPDESVHIELIEWKEGRRYA